MKLSKVYEEDFVFLKNNLSVKKALMIKLEEYSRIKVYLVIS